MNRFDFQNWWASIRLWWRSKWGKFPLSKWYRMTRECWMLENKSYKEETGAIFDALEEHFPNKDWNWHERYVEFVIECIEHSRRNHEQV